MEIKYQAKHPVQFTERLLRNIGKILNKRVIVIRDLWTAVELAKNNRVLFITDSPDARDLFEQVVCRNRAFGNDDEVLFINNWQIDLLFSEESNGKKKKQKRKTWEEILSKCEKEWPMKFDYCIQNPPYDRNLHLQVLEQTLKVADIVVNISPVRWLQDPFAPYVSRSDYCKFEKSISKKIESLNIIPAKDASKLFDASFAMNLGIYVCSDKGGYAYQHNDPLTTKIVERTLENNWKNFTYLKEYQKPQKQFILNVSGFGGSATMGFDYVTCKTYKSQLNAPAPKLTSHNACNAYLFSFNTELERIHFFSCYLTKFMRWTYRLWKSDVHTGAEKVPYFGDYTKPWTNKRFCEYFGITGFISDTTAVPGSEWERILKEM